MVAKQASTARTLALRALRDIAQGAFASEAIDQVLKKQDLQESDRGLFTQLVYGVLRERGFLDQVLGRYVSKAKTPEALLDLLRLAAYQCLSLDKVPDYAAVNEAVELAKKKYGPGAGRLVNAVLRRLLREPADKAEARVQEKLESYPGWMLRRWRKSHPKLRLQEMLEYFAAPAPLWAWVNSRKARAIEEFPNSETWIDLGSQRRETWLKWIREGAISIQDKHSHEVALAVGAKAGERILDACAGHGGKSSVIAMSAPTAELYIHEPSKDRQEELRENFSRLGLSIPASLRDPLEPLDRELSFDAILIDAPCSGMGTLGRKPEIRWRLKPSDIERLAMKQRDILEEWIPSLKEGGRLVYAVCSLEPEEGRENIAALLEAHPELSLEEERELWAKPGEGDGFYLARLRKISSRPSLASGK